MNTRAIFIALVVVLSACGGGDHEEEDTSTYCPPPTYDYGDGRGCVNEPIMGGGQGGQG